MGKHARLWLIIGFLTVVASNACSPVSFSTASSEGDGVNGNGNPSCAPDCDGDGNPDPGVPVLKQKTITVKAPTSEVDVLLIVDDSGSMVPERQKLGERMRNFTDRLNGLDWRICVTTTSPLSSLQGKLYQFTNGQTVLTTNSANTGTDVNGDGVMNYEDVLLETLQGIQSSDGDEQGIAAAGYTIRNKTHSCFRQNAALSVVLISDEDERSTGGWPKYENHNQYRPLESDNWPKFVFDSLYDRFMDDQKPFTFHSLVIRSQKDWVASAGKYCEEVQSDYAVFYGTRYEEMSRQSGGIIGNICADDYGAELTGFADRVKTTLQAVTLECAPVGNPEVTISPGSYPYAVQGNKIVFQNQVPAGTVVSVKYYCTK